MANLNCSVFLNTIQSDPEQLLHSCRFNRLFYVLYILKSDVVACSLMYPLANINMMFVLTAAAKQKCSRDFPGGP